MHSVCRSLVSFLGRYGVLFHDSFYPLSVDCITDEPRPTVLGVACSLPIFLIYVCRHYRTDRLEPRVSGMGC
jgi:hypothetical protein